MTRPYRQIARFLKEEEGPTATEYAILLTLIILVAVGVISSMGTKISATFNTVDTEFNVIAGS